MYVRKCYVYGGDGVSWREQAQQKIFKPDRVPVYCTCEMPYNPDQKMVMCEHCKDWCVSPFPVPVCVWRYLAIDVESPNIPYTARKRMGRAIS